MLETLPSLHLTLWLLKNCVLSRQGSLFQSGNGSGMRHLYQRLTSYFERTGNTGLLERVCKNAIFAFKLAYYLFNLFRFGLASIGIYHSTILVFFWNLFINTSLQIIISSLSSVDTFTCSILIHVNVLILES